MAQDLEEAVRLLKLCADQQCGLGEYYLGLCHEKGLGVPKDLTAARSLYALAAERGVPDAAERLAQLPSPSEVDENDDDDEQLPPPAEFKDEEREALCAEAEAALRALGLGGGA